MEQFEKQFFTVGMLATELGERPGPLSKRLEAHGIRPIYSVPNVSRVYYISVVREVLKNARHLAEPLNGHRQI